VGEMKWRMGRAESRNDQLPSSPMEVDLNGFERESKGWEVVRAGCENDGSQI
jgi:hypothetical protein